MFLGDTIVLLQNFVRNGFWLGLDLFALGKGRRVRFVSYLGFLRSAGCVVRKIFVFKRVVL